MVNWKSTLVFRALQKVRLVWGVAVLALIVYAVTLCRGGYPGASAANVVMVAGLVPAHLATHPLWSLVCHGVVWMPVGSVAVRLNAFSALCGAASVLLLGMLVARLLMALEAVGWDLEPPDGRGRGAIKGEAVCATHQAPLACGERDITAECGGAVAAMAFAFSSAAWSASTRLQFESFEVLLFLVAGHLLMTCHQQGRKSAALVLAFLCGAGCVESIAFVVSAPVFLVLTLQGLSPGGRRRARVRSSMILALILSTGCGAFANLLLLWHLTAAGAIDRPLLSTIFGVVVHDHAAEVRTALPRVGWIWVILLAYVPAAVVALAGRRAVCRRIAGVTLMHLFLVLASVLCLANVSFSPWGQALEQGRLPVMASLVVAGTTGYLFAYWCLHAARCAPVGKRRRQGWRATADRGLGFVMVLVLVAAVCLAAAVNGSAASGRQGEFGDRVAGSVLAHLSDRDWVASDGLLDNHLLLVAQAQGRALRVISLAADTHPAQLQQIRAWIDTDPRLASIRLRLRNAVERGAAALIDEWLRGDHGANRALFALCAPEIWLRSGWKAVPEGCGFGGVQQLEEVRVADLLARNRADWDLLEKVLVPVASLPPPLANVRQGLRRNLSRAANDLGVLLEDCGRPDEARETYGAAIRFDNRNICALLNLLQLPPPPAAPLGARQRMKKEACALLDAMHPHPPILSLVLRYGEIRQPGILAETGRVWSMLGQPVLAQSQLDRATALDPVSFEIRQQVACTLAVQGDTAAAARTYRAILERETNNTAAMIGLAAMSLCGGQTSEARRWLERARREGARDSAWVVPYASLLQAEGQTSNALACLQTFTENNPGQMEAWALEADILLKQQALVEVERHVLPAMRRAAPHADHYLIHVVHARLLAQERPVDRGAIRLALLRALSLRSDLVDVRADLLRVDLQGGNRTELLSDVDEALRFNPDHALANYIAGNTLAEKGEWTRAEEHLRRSLKVAPSAAALNDLAEALRHLGRLAEAEESAREAIRRESRFGQAWDTLGRILLDANRVADGEEAIERALALRDHDPSVHLSLARVRLAQGRVDDCRRILLHPGCDPDELPANLVREVEALQRRAAQSTPAPSKTETGSGL